MPYTRLGEGFEEIMDRRRFTFEVIFIAIILALAINLLSTGLANLIPFEAVGPLYWCIFTVSISLYLFAFVLILLKRLSNTALEEQGFFVILPVFVDNVSKQAEIVYHSKYEAAKAGHELFANKHLKNIRETFVNAWPGENPLKTGEFKQGDPCWNALADLTLAILFSTLKEFGQKSLGISAKFHGRYRRFAKKLNPYKLERKDWPEQLQNKDFIKEDILHIQLPKGMNLGYNSSSDGREFDIHSKHISFTLRVCGDWTLAKNQEKAREILCSNKGQAGKTSMILVPVECDIACKWRYRYSDMAVYEYLWFQRLYEKMREHLAWDEFLNRQKQYQRP